MERSIENHFVDWESQTFGLGYGSGEEPVLSALRSFLSMCDEGSHGHQYNYERLEVTLGAAVAWLLINRLGRVGIIEYGTSPRYAWLTPQGEALKAFMLGKTVDELVSIIIDGSDDATYCTPTFCNCGPDGYSRKKLCHNPFWKEVSP